MSRHLFLTIISLAILITGCTTNRHELSTLGVASALSIDKKGDNYVIAVQIINPDSLREKGTDPVVSTYTGEGPTLNTSLKRIEYLLPRYLFLPDLRLVVLSEEIARNEFDRVVDYMLRNPRFRSDFIFVVSKDQQAAQVLNQLTPTEKIPADFVYEILTNYAGGKYIFRNRTLNAVARDMEVKDIFLPGLKVLKGDSDQQQEGAQQPLVTSGLDPQDNAIFRNNQFVGWTSQKENRAILYLLSPKSTHSLVVKAPDCKDEVSIIVKDSITRITGEFVNGKPRINIKLDVKSFVGDTECKITHAQSVESMEQEVEKQVQVAVEDGVYSILRKYHADIFGFGWMLARKDPRQWKKIEANWRKSLDKLDVVVKVDAVLTGSGQIRNPVPHR